MVFNSLFFHFVVVVIEYCSNAEAKVPKPLLEEGNCESNQLACADATCLPNEYFCDGLLLVHKYNLYFVHTQYSI